MTKWEYTIREVFALGPHGMNSLGANGWELVCIVATSSQNLAYFKRPLPDYMSTESEGD
jgi:hypothetical protein